MLTSGRPPRRLYALPDTRDLARQNFLLYPEDGSSEHSGIGPEHQIKLPKTRR